jgi:hypothetical protein
MYFFLPGKYEIAFDPFDPIINKINTHNEKRERYKNTQRVITFTDHMLSLIPPNPVD